MRPNLQIAAVLATVLTLAACAGDSERGGDPKPAEPAEAIDWTDPSRVVNFDFGWSVGACDGEAPLLCVEHDGVPVGLVEAAAYPIDSFDSLDPGAGADANLAAFAADYFEALSADRAEGCGEGYGFEPFAPEPFTLGDVPGVVFGFGGSLADGSPSELNLQYATVVGDRIVLITAAAYDEGGCPGRDELHNFDSEGLTAFRPFLETVLRQSELPVLG